MEKFVCNHCGHKFEHEPAENLACPKCYWSTSVRPEKNLFENGSGGDTSSPIPFRTAPQNIEPLVPLEPRNFGPILRWAGGILFVLLFMAIISFAWRHLRKQDEIIKKIETKNAEEIATRAPEMMLTPDKQEILNRVVTFDPQRPLSGKEKELLGPRFIFRSRGARGIPTTPWTEKEFETFLKTQQAHYKITLGWSYERKLREIFKTHSVAATHAFEAKDYLKARDEWIRSLAFPIYQDNVPRHRGVVLTMLRPYINDTLAKIGAMNTSLMGSDLAGFESKIKSDYDHLTSLLKEESWDEANAKILELKIKLQEAGKQVQPSTPPALPPDISKVDTDIREVLLLQVAPAHVSAPDWDTLQQDLAAKERLIQSRLPGAVDEALSNYQAAQLFIKNKSWEQAREELRKIDVPEEWAQDAREKIAVLDQLMQIRADTQETK